ncbi:unnamed protein product [Ranitomeya imitator]|uniref:Fibronectin type-III domain-containing protein n=1 Tax=Ranitomeya imitator TaxID=111125 RepID=A0ABN9LA10_9NEOB|nr:unnamed protein product [Ranitomeya imitator]
MDSTIHTSGSGMQLIQDDTSMRAMARRFAVSVSVVSRGLRRYQETGPAYDLTFCEVRNTSLVILWKEPIYSGTSPVMGYLVEYREIDGEQWTRVNETATASRYLKVKGLEEGKTYVFQIRAVNASGIGKASDISEPVLVQARPGVQEITAGVDEEGNIYLAYNCTEISEASQFTWCKAYEEITDDEKFRAESIGENSKLYFKNPDKADLGTYSVAVSDTDGISSSYVLDADELERLMALSYEIRNPIYGTNAKLAM